MFDKIIIKASPLSRPNDLTILVHPFNCPETHRMTSKKYYDDADYKYPFPQWQKDLADQLWDTIPGLQVLYFRNGEINIEHVELFTNNEITNALSEIVMPYLQKELQVIKSPIKHLINGLDIK